MRVIQLGYELMNSLDSERERELLLPDTNIYGRSSCHGITLLLFKLRYLFREKLGNHALYGCVGL